MKLSLFALSFLFATAALAGRYELPQPRTWGPNKVPVLYISPAVQLGKTTENAVYLKSKAVLQWGTSVFETGTLVYKCKPSTKKCQAEQFLSSGSYESCKVKNEKIRCTNRLEASGSETEDRDPHLDNPRVETDPERLEIEGDRSSPAFEEPLNDDHHSDYPQYSDVSDDGSSPLF